METEMVEAKCSKCGNKSSKGNTLMPKQIAKKYMCQSCREKEYKLKGRKV